MTWTHDVVVVGAGSAGLTAAGGLARLGLAVALVERGALGGECLHTGCVPSKALIAAAARAQAVREAARFGVHAPAPHIDVAGVRGHVRGAIAAIAPHDAAERFEAWGVEVIRGQARFTGRRALEVEGRTLRAPRVVLATGSRPALPPTPGLADTPHLTNETLWALERLPQRLAILGAGPIGAEMAQAFRRLGCQVVVVDRGALLSRDDPQAASLIADRLRAEGVELRLGVEVTAVRAHAGGVALALAGGEEVRGDALLVATGRAPQVEALALDAAGIAWDEAGVKVDAARRTTNRAVFAIGDCRAGPRFTHAAGYEGALMVRRLGFGLPARADYAALPRVTYTDPELAQVGLTEGEARDRHRRVQTVRQPFADNDRAVTERRTDGFLKLVKADGRLVGATMVGAGAGELAGPWVAAIGGGGASAWALSGRMAPYPTRGEISQAAAMALYEGALFGPWARRWAGLLARLRR